MVQGSSIRKASTYTEEQGNRVPPTTLKQLYVKIFGATANSHNKILPSKQKEMVKEIFKFELPTQGPDSYFTKDEEELIMGTLEFAYERGFPYDEDNLLNLATSMLQVCLLFVVLCRLRIHI